MRLEEDLGMILLNRDRRSVRLTDEDASSLDEARKILADVEGAVERLREVHRGFRGTLRSPSWAPAASWSFPPFSSTSAGNTRP